MPRIRTIKPEFWSSPGIAQLEFEWRLLYIAMWNWADDYGRGTCEPRELLGFVFPNDDEIDVGGLRRGLGGLRRHIGVTFYRVDGRHYFQIPSWNRHQKIDKRSKRSKFPAPEDGEIVDPESWQVIDQIPEHSGDSAEDSGENSDISEEPAGIPGSSGAGKGNRGTEILGGGSSNQLGRAGVRETPLLENLDALAAAHADRLRCARHKGLPDGEVPACRQCQALREADEARQGAAERARKAERRAIIDACPTCDDNGFVLVNGVAKKCSHSASSSPGDESGGEVVPF